MNNSLLMPIVSDDVKMVAVVFLNDDTGDDMKQIYTYKCDISVNKGDLVIVEARATYKVARVIDDNVPIDMDSKWTYRWIVQLIETSEHEDRLRVENAVISEVNKQRANHARAQIFEAYGIGDRGAILRKAHEDALEDKYEPSNISGVDEPLDIDDVDDRKD